LPTVTIGTAIHVLGSDAHDGSLQFREAWFRLSHVSMTSDQETQREILG
jgi:hypothetical protein